MDKTPRELYHDLITEHDLYDVLDNIPEISYTEKYEILSDLVKRFGAVVVNKALIMYNTNNIKTHKIVLHLVKNTLIGICGRVINQR